MDWQYCTLRTIIKDKHLKFIQLYKKMSIKLTDNQYVEIQSLQSKTLQFLANKTTIENSSRPDDFTSVRRYFVPLDSSYEKFVGSIFDALRNQKKEFEANQETELEKKKILLSEFEEKSKELARINEFDTLNTSLGAIPITLNVIILSLPICLILAGLHCISLCRYLLRLRLEMDRLHKFLDSDKKIITSDQTSLLAPIWIDHKESWLKKMLNWLLLTSPLMLALSTIFIYLIFNVFVDASKNVPGGVIGISSFYLLLLAYSVYELNRLYLLLLRPLKLSTRPCLSSPKN